MRNKVRIIGGHWRGRLLTFATVPGLRPTPDRVRETVFNWLNFDLPGSHCLDLFAGSGALGFEAASRGAASVSLVESHPEQLTHLRANAERLAATGVAIHAGEALAFLAQAKAPFDIVFVDPPYAAGLLPEVLQALTGQGCLQPLAKIYFELPKRDVLPVMPKTLQLIKQQRAGQIHYYLWQYQPDAPDQP
ncbi:MAG: 16S rRNA (guanine(966)-N(2))-methyltransferase RsmD [Methylococcales bacterium]|nr:16S rRNA (guanine(966)-N(2))-methyltransferase RsmD [Methylococcales bacterium]